jgi:glutaredoxin-like protein
MAKLIAFLDGDEGAQEMRKALQKVEEGNEIQYRDINVSADEAEKFGIKLTPALVVMGDEDMGMRFYGIPRGKEEKSLKNALKMAHGGENGLKEDDMEKARAIDIPVTIEVFTTPQCTYCPKAVKVAFWFAQANSNITAEIIDATEFDELAMKYKITAVPTLVINDSVVATVQGSTKEYIESYFNLIGHLQGHEHH